MKKYTYTPLLLVLTLMGLVACSHDELNDASSELPGVNKNANTDAGYAQRTEMPHLLGDNIFNTYTTTFHGKETITYSMEYDTDKRHARWIAYTFYNETNEVHWNRKQWESTSWEGDPFQPDWHLPKWAQVQNSEHARDGYDRGHLCASADRLYSQEANEQTFYLSNMSPQRHEFNVGSWNELEGRIRIWGKDRSFCDTLYVVKGGTIRDGEYTMSNRHLVVPRHFFVAVLRCKAGTYSSIAFWFNHNNDISTPLRKLTIPVNELEKRTGIDFFCNLPDRMEEKVEELNNADVWGLK